MSKAIEFYVGLSQWTLEMSPAPYPSSDDEDGSGPWGRTLKLEQRVQVRTHSDAWPVHPEQVKHTLLHELLHVAIHESGYDPESHYGPYVEEDVVGVLTTPLKAMLTDPRNAELRLLLGFPIQEPHPESRLTLPQVQRLLQLIPEPMMRREDDTELERALNEIVEEHFPF